MRIKSKKRFIARISELIVILVSFISTPFAINYATSFRGYKAVGGEYLIPIAGLIIAMTVETIYQDSKEKRKESNGKHRR